MRQQKSFHRYTEVEKQPRVPTLARLSSAIGQELQKVEQMFTDTVTTIRRQLEVSPPDGRS